jgi:hypothetical protein
MSKPTRPTTRGNFSDLSAAIPTRLVFRSWGQEKTGKNHFGFTGPSPIYGQYLDPGGIEGVAEKFIRGEYGEKKIIRAVMYRFDKSKHDHTAAQEIRDRFIEDYEQALGEARMVQWDETEVWELFRWAEFGGDSDSPRNYAGLNARYRSLLQAAYDAGVNLQLIQKVKERWTTDAKGRPVPSGVFEPTGFKEANYIVQANLEHAWTPEGGFTVRVVNCRQNMSIAGQDFPGLTFPDLGQLVFPETNEEDWR